MAETFSIREVQLSDLVALAELNHEFNGVGMTPEQIAVRLRSAQRSELVVVAEMSDCVVGFACVQICESVCYVQPWAELTELYVRDDYRRRGLGSGLVQEAERLARQKDATEIVVRTGAKNAAGKALYNALGFTTRPDLTFAKPLSEPA